MRNVVGGVGKPKGVVEGVYGITPGVEGTGEHVGMERGMIIC